MTDNLKHKYKEYTENINPSDEFIARLTKTLEDEQANQKRKKFRIISRVSAAAACFVMLFGISAVIYSISFSNPAVEQSDQGMSSEANNYAGSASTDAIHTIPFEKISWYDESLTKESLPKALAQKLASSLDYLSFNSENKFVNAEKADAQSIEQFIQLMNNSEQTSEEAAGETVYYMAVFNDRTIAKFSISGNEYIIISGDSKIYKNF